MCASAFLGFPLAILGAFHCSTANHICNWRQ